MREEYTDLYRKLGVRVAMIRNAKQLTQKQVAGLIGSDPYYVSKIESGVVGQTLDKFFAVAQALGVPPKELLEFDDIEKFM